MLVKEENDFPEMDGVAEDQDNCYDDIKFDYPSTTYLNI